MRATTSRKEMGIAKLEIGPIICARFSRYRDDNVIALKIRADPRLISSYKPNFHREHAYWQIAKHQFTMRFENLQPILCGQKILKLVKVWFKLMWVNTITAIDTLIARKRWQTRCFLSFTIQLHHAVVCPGGRKTIEFG